MWILFLIASRASSYIVVEMRLTPPRRAMRLVTFQSQYVRYKMEGKVYLISPFAIVTLLVSRCSSLFATTGMRLTDATHRVPDDFSVWDIRVSP